MLYEVMHTLYEVIRGIDVIGVDIDAIQILAGGDPNSIAADGEGGAVLAWETSGDIYASYNFV